jgi:uncharacterized phage protein gp47/JayE
VAYIDLPIELDVEVMKDDAVALLQETFPGWEPAAGNLETILIEAIAEMAYEQAAVAASVPSAIFRAFGLRLVGLPPIDGAVATGISAWTATDTLGHTIPAAAQVTVGDIAFETTEEATIPIGESSVNISVAAIEVGTAANDLTGAMDLVDTLAYVDSVVLSGLTAGGVDAETDEDYLARLVEELQLMAPRPIVPEDFSTLAHRIAGVDRATAIDGYNPGDDTYDNERMITIAAVDEDGEAVSAGILNDIETYLNTLREATFVVNTTDPAYTTIDVVSTVTVLPGFDTATVLIAAAAAVQEFFQPYNWGRVSTIDNRLQRAWVNTQRVGYLNVAEVIKRTDGVAFIETLTVEAGTTDVDLSADPAPLTRPGTITITEA